MAYRDFSSFNSEEWSLKKTKVGDNSKILTINTNELQIQAPVLSTIEDLNFKDSSLKFTFFKLGDGSKSVQFKEWMNNFDNYIIDLIESEKSNIWSESQAVDITKDKLEDIYNNTISKRGKIKVYLSRDKNTKLVNLPIVDKDNNLLELEEVPSDSRILSIIRCRYVRVSSESITPQWEMISMNIKEDRPKKTLPYIIHDSDSESDDDFEFVMED